ncbi:MAG: bifunctional adenosylcobinamide kinase/adenosylcobinamide-phosphate guanylyltransferase [Magnetococcales bacterium]|nr:bifunctional adenosylcobinamide kinase/adenosylcobinamide-phosphate guanylyltransferase [Magnetococcales bacterium]MBF0321424.1 bifunctional adenosylcobinamide kinase/adenosylcobinamide-phosphate guanylyltransferase [Magnetococcales bacterium]
MIELVLGGSRSGKSRHAESLAMGSGLAVTYVATAVAGDAEMADRIAQHQLRRPVEWGLAEAPRDLATHLARLAAPDRFLLVDCLTLWLSHVLEDDNPLPWNREREALLTIVPKLPGRIVMVSNETGLGIVPMGRLTRRFADEAGLLHQELARLCHRVTFLVAGLPIFLKGTEP